MTLSLAFAGVTLFVLAMLLSRPSGASANSRDFVRFSFAFGWPVILVAMLAFAYNEGDQIGSAPDNGVRLAGQTRVAVTSAGVALDSELADIRFGGDPKRDDIVIDGYPASMLLARREQGRVTIELGPVQSGNEHFVAFVNEQRLTEDVAEFQGESFEIAVLRLENPPVRGFDFEQAKGDIEHNFVLTKPSGGWLVDFVDPEVFYVPGGNIRPASADTSNQRRDGDNVTPFNSLGRRFDPSFENTELVLPDLTGVKTTVRGRDQRKEFPNSEVEIRQGDFLTVLRVDPLNISAGLRGFAWFAMFWTISFSFLLTWRMRMQIPVNAAILGVAELLLLIRVLMAIEGGMIEETLRSRQALSDALLALPLGLMVIHAATQSIDRRLLLTITGLGAMASIVGYAIVQNNAGALEGSNGWVIGIGLVLTFLAILLRLGLNKVIKWSAAFAQWVAQRLTRFPRINDILGEWSVPVALMAVIGTLILAAKLVLLVAFDASERFFVSVSIFFVPLTILAFLPMILKLQRSDKRALTGGVSFLVGIGVFVLFAQAVWTLGLGWVLRTVGWTNAQVGGDMGLAIVLSLAFCIVVATIWLSRDAKRSPLDLLASGTLSLGLVLCFAHWLAGNSTVASWAVPIALVVIGLGLVAAGRSNGRPASAVWLIGVSGFAALILVTSSPALQPSMDSPPDSAADISTSSRPLIRMTSALAPERLGFLSSSRARENREAIQDISEYGKTLNGYGFLNVPNIARGVRGQQFSDFAIAVHFVFPFGRLALAGLVLLTSTLFVLAAPQLRERSATATAGVLSAAVFVFTCLYMALANLLLAPVTGRNFYLLAPQSHSDLIEGLMLLVMTAVFLNHRAANREQEA